MATAHAKLGASSAHRWMNCPGSIRLSEGMPNTSSPAAREGTVAHALGEMALAQPDGERLDFMEAQIGKAVEPDHPDEVVTRDMVNAVRLYVDLCSSLIRICDSYEIELRVSLKGYGDSKSGRVAAKMFGTADFVAVMDGDGILHVADYKHGQGVTVEPEQNPQLKYYAAGVLAYLMREQPDRYAKIKHVLTTVVQPRDDHLLQIRHHGYEVADLLFWVEHKLLPAAIRTADPDAPLSPGDWCRFCPAQAKCPARRTQQLEKAKMVFEEQEELIVPEKPASALSVDELRMVLDSAEDIIAWVKSCQKYAHEGLEQGSIAEADQKRLGYKLVKKRAMRRFAETDEKVADALCEEFGLGDEELFTKKLRSPAQIEKEIGTAAVKKSGLWSALVKSESSGTTLARDDDNRPAIKKAKAKDKFAKAEPEDKDEGII